MILPNLPNRLGIRTSVFSAAHPIFTLGFFALDRRFVIGYEDRWHPRAFVSDYPPLSWHAAQAIYRAFLREFEE